MLLSACMIVKNEELTIRKCLDSLAGIVDEVIVVDTGSSDGTLKIAKEYGARTYSYNWDDNFSNARNESLKYALGDFIIVLDADEYLDPIQKHDLRAFLESTDADGVLINLRSYVGSLSRPSKTPDVSLLRIFRRGYHYSGAIHEQVYPSIAAVNGKVVELNLVLHHLGYLPEFVLPRNKINRNLNLVKLEWEQDPTNVFYRSNLVAEYFRAEQYENCIDLAQDIFSDYKAGKIDEIQTHLAIRSLIHLIRSYLQLGESSKAREIGSEASTLFPKVVDVQKRFAETLMASGGLREAVDVLMECRKIGEPKTTMFDSYAGMGSYLAAADLGLIWLQLGDEIVARNWFLTSFSENPSIEYTMFLLMHLLPRDVNFLRGQIESRITDWLTYAYYVEAYAMLELDGAEALINRYETKFGSSPISERARMAIAVRAGGDKLERLVEEHPTAQRYLLLGIFYLNNGNVEHAQENLLRSGAEGQYLLEINRKCNVDKNFRFRLTPIIRELIAMGAENLIRQWLHEASDRQDVWVYIKYSPLSHVLGTIEWPGATTTECEENALRLFQERDLSGATDWLERAMHFQPTVTKVLIECDLALAHSNVEHVRAVLRNAEVYFPESEVIKNVSSKLGNSLNQFSNSIQMTAIDLLGGAGAMNPLDVYKATTVQTMPLNVQLSQLHERGALLTQLVRELSIAGKVNDMRKYIEELQNILTFLRSSLDHRLEVSKITDRTYEYMYKITVKWFLQPDSVSEEYDTVLEFWKSWAETWKKVQSH